MTREEATALLQALKRQMRCGHDIPAIEADAIARRYVAIASAFQAGRTFSA